MSAFGKREMSRRRAPRLRPTFAPPAARLIAVFRPRIMRGSNKQRA